ncbi:protein-glutamine gamma-glutamyltransferase [Mesobacillus sp. AQ2]|jgi:protein-glutamine gamma-glutamyltransferase|uniref:protein-glutamine gamma-glutamyltransferase n=1 Tax=Bacillaceae TaxID=186817 RepID=UPI0011A9F699|nr:MULTISPECIES: protein-glutamine gamma-glutamyltransferase [Bacillaceae]MCM3124764.1 protein-glutamine gamma-glutamyltransferase [Mesobacillus sp. MER 33]MCM3232927.1 protein-glutamine gamma-glutamyltransferase [Mesobacillus sp. MER 48]WHX42010.1 protein-glutamine gamma-glutamyltransferase [Mesobacillus sp. AQ2]
MIIIRFPDAAGKQKLQNLSGKQREIYDHLDHSLTLFEFDSTFQLLFEIRLRENIIEAALKLKDASVAFTSFKYSKFNPIYWTKGPSGYLLNPNVRPSDAISDIFNNGQEYGFECSTAMVIIFYKAVLESIRVADFNYLFRGLLVWNWNYDPDLAIITLEGSEFIPGDVVYFMNPDFEMPIWRGENAVVLGKGLYYGHGIGIGTAKEMIEALNTLRKEGSTTSAFMLQQHSRLNSKYLSQFSDR